MSLVIIRSFLLILFLTIWYRFLFRFRNPNVSLLSRDMRNSVRNNFGFQCLNAKKPISESSNPIASLSSKYHECSLLLYSHIYMFKIIWYYCLNKTKMFYVSLQCIFSLSLTLPKDWSLFDFVYCSILVSFSPWLTYKRRRGGAVPLFLV